MLLSETKLLPKPSYLTSNNLKLQRLIKSFIKIQVAKKNQIIQLKKNRIQYLLKFWCNKTVYLCISAYWIIPSHLYWLQSLISFMGGLDSYTRNKQEKKNYHQWMVPTICQTYCSQFIDDIIDRNGKCCLQDVWNLSE